MSNNGTNQTDSPSESSGGGNGGSSVYSERQQLAGGLRHLRDDARMVARILSCGVVDEDQFVELMRGTFELAVAELRKPEPSPRNLAALHKVFEAGAKLELETLKHADKACRDADDDLRVGLSPAPILEVVVANRQEAVEFAEIREQLLARVNGKAG